MNERDAPGPRPSQWVCAFYRTERGCARGNRCNFLHLRTCRFFSTPEGCRLGSRCKFDHHNPSSPVGHPPTRSQADSSTPNPVRNPVAAPRQALHVATLTEQEQRDARDTELRLLHMKFPDMRLNRESAIITFEPTDPDWPFEVRSIQLEIRIPSLYPKKMLSVSCLPGEALPPQLVRCINEAISNYLEERTKITEETGCAVLVMRPFLRWLDRSLLDLFTSGLKQAKNEIERERSGIEVAVSGGSRVNDQPSERRIETLPELATEGMVKYVKGEDDMEEVHQRLAELKTADGDDDEYEYSSSDEYSDDDQGDRYEQNSSRPYDDLNPQRCGIELRLLNFRYNTAAYCTVSCRQISLTLTCDKCSTRFDLVLNPHSPVARLCDKCRGRALAAFRPSLIHQCSSSLGFLDVELCAPMDFKGADSQLAFGCSNCNANTVSSGMNGGEVKTLFCQSCHEKFEVVFDSLKFVDLHERADISNAKCLESGRQRRPRDKFVLEAGKPLPKRGTCTHYRKSYRWLRFPCCSKVFPCDLCHDQAEPDHEMQLANRMICGFCSKEQAFQKSRPCVSCSRTMAGTTSFHWEGGRGCRNQKKMDRRDKHKYRNKNKTISRKKAVSSRPTSSAK